MDSVVNIQNGGGIYFSGFLVALDCFRGNHAFLEEGKFERMPRGSGFKILKQKKIKEKTLSQKVS